MRAGDRESCQSAPPARLRLDAMITNEVLEAVNRLAIGVEALRRQVEQLEARLEHLQEGGLN